MLCCASSAGAHGPQLCQGTLQQKFFCRATPNYPFKLCLANERNSNGLSQSLSAYFLQNLFIKEHPVIWHALGAFCAQFTMHGPSKRPQGNHHTVHATCTHRPFAASNLACACRCSCSEACAAPQGGHLLAAADPQLRLLDNLALSGQQQPALYGTPPLLGAASPATMLSTTGLAAFPQPELGMDAFDHRVASLSMRASAAGVLGDADLWAQGYAGGHSLVGGVGPWGHDRARHGHDAPFFHATSELTWNPPPRGWGS